MRRLVLVLIFGALAWGHETALLGSACAQSSALSADSRVPARRDEEAKKVFEVGRAALEAGRFEAAVRFFEEAYDLSGRPELLFNIGTAFDRLRRDEEAARYFERYLFAAPDAANALAVEARLTVLRQRKDYAHGARAQAEPVAAVPSPVPTEARAVEHDNATGSRRAKILWGVLGTVAVVGGVTAALLLSRDEEVKQEGPLLGSRGAVAQALVSF